MILLDTNIVSEPLRQAPEQRVVDWLDAQPLETLYLAAMTVAELRAGVASLPEGRKRHLLDHAIEQRVLPTFAGRVLAFDLSCTLAYAQILAETRRAGATIQTSDALIAAVAKTHGLMVATRDVGPFAAAGIQVFNPWTHSPSGTTPPIHPSSGSTSGPKP